jgi:acyl carrier protein
MVDLISFVEAEGDIEIQQEDVTLENFDTVARILELVASRASG